MNTGVQFFLVLLPMIAVFVGILWLKRSGAEMAVLAVVLAGLIANWFFYTPGLVVLGAVIYGVLKSLGITVAVVLTMFMIFMMKESGALGTISKAIGNVVEKREEQALFIGIGFGTFVTSLGVVTPALFPPLLMAMGFSPGAAVAVAVLGYNAATSFALLSIPVTLPASAFGMEVYTLTLKIALFLPVVSTVISLAMLWIVGGWRSVREYCFPATLIGLIIGVGAIILALFMFPIMVFGVALGILGMASLWLYFKIHHRGATRVKQKVDRHELVRALSPWIILIAIAAVVSIPDITAYLKTLDGDGFKSFWTAYKVVDLDILVQPYTPIGVSILLSYPILKPTRQQVAAAAKVWSRRIWGPVIAYSLFFGLAYIMAFSAMQWGEGELVPSSYYPDHNMNYIAGTTLASVFGIGYIFVAATLGLFGAIVGGSETGSNMLFYGIQKQVSDKIGLNNSEFTTLYASHANAGGVASAITPSKINNAVATIGAGKGVESDIMVKHMAIVIFLTIIIGIMCAIFIRFVP